MISRYAGIYAFKYETTKIYNQYLKKIVNIWNWFNFASCEHLLSKNIPFKHSIKLPVFNFVSEPINLAIDKLCKNGYKKKNIDTVCCDILELDSETIKSMEYNKFDTDYW